MSPRPLPETARRGWCPGLARPMPTGDGLLARIHPPLGVLTVAQAAAVAEAARRFGNGYLDLTARANLQIRGVSEATRAPLARFLEDAGLGDTRHDGGPQRLTLTLPLAGRDPRDLMDMAALARTIEEAGRGIDGLPPKSLVAVGFAMAEADLSVTALGSERVALLLASAEGPVPVGECGRDEAPAAIATLLTAFAGIGRRRMRDLNAGERNALPLASAGESGAPRRSRAGNGASGPVATGPASGNVAPPLCPQAWQDALPSTAGRFTSRSGDPDSWNGPGSPLLTGEGAPRASPNRYVNDVAHGEGRENTPSVPAPGLSETVPGLVVLALDAPFGRCSADALFRLVAVAEETGAGEIRLSRSRGVVLLPNSRERAAARLADLSADFITVADDPRRAIMACTGAPACASGTTPTLADAGRLAVAFAPFAAEGLRAHVSGCAKGCAHPAAAALTLVGRDGRYGIVLDGAPGDPPAELLPIEAALERLGKAATIGLAAAFAPEAADTGRNRRPA